MTYPGIEVTSRLFWSNSGGLRVDFIFRPHRIAVRTLLFGIIFAKFEDLGVVQSAINSCDSLLNMLIFSVWLKS